MPFLSAVCYFLIAWSLVFLLDYLLRLRRCLPYLQFANNYSLDITPFQIRFYTHRYEANAKSSGVAEVPPPSVSSFRRVLSTLWFSAGALISVFCLVGITLYLAQMLINDVSMLASLRPRVAPFRVAPPFGVDAAIPVPTHQHPPVDADEAASLKRILEKTAVEGKREDEKRKAEEEATKMLQGPGPAEYDVLDEGGKEDRGLIPIIPGYNLPWSHMPIFMVVLLFATIIHEWGHSWAATSNGVPVNGFGFFLIAVYPGAFTEINSNGLKSITTFKRLQVYGAGIWHNLVLAGLAYLLITATPFILSPLFLTGHGLTVKDVDARSGLSGPAGLFPGHIVDAIDECRVREMADWRECVRLLERQRNGRCIRKSRLDATRTEQTSMGLDELQCCGSFTNITNAHMCFESTETRQVNQMATKKPSLNKLFNIGDDMGKKQKKREAESKTSLEKADESQNKSKMEAEEVVQGVVRVEKRVYNCMSARYVTDQPVCNKTLLCQQYKDDPDNRFCVYPALFNGTQLARITVRELDRPVLYVGSLDELIRYVRIDPLTRRYEWVEDWWAEALGLLPRYLYMLSLALGLLNAVPCAFLDGHHIVITLVQCLFRHMPKRRRNTLTSLILLLGGLLLASNILIGFVKLAVL